MFILNNTKYLKLYGLEIANEHRSRYLKRALNNNNVYSPNNDVL